MSRARTGIVLLPIQKVLKSATTLPESSIEKTSSSAYLLNHAEVPRADLPDYVLDRIRKSLQEYDHSPEVARIGLLSSESRLSEGTLDTIRLHAIIQHELRKQFVQSPVDVSIQQVRRTLGLSSSGSSGNKRGLIEQFKNSDCIFENPQTNSGLQLLSESWGVAQHINRIHQVADIRSSSPDLIEKFRNELLSNRKLFAPSTHSNAEVINDILEQEVDKLLVKRFHL